MTVAPAKVTQSRRTTSSSHPQGCDGDRKSRCSKPSSFRMVRFGGGRDRGSRPIARAPSSSGAPRKSSPSWSSGFLVWDRMTRACHTPQRSRETQTRELERRRGPRSFSSPPSSAAMIPPRPPPPLPLHTAGVTARTEPSSPRAPVSSSDLHRGPEEQSHSGRGGSGEPGREGANLGPPAYCLQDWG